MKILESYKKIAKSMLTEHAWDRKFGEPLPTLEDVMKEAEVDDEKMIKYKDKDGETKQMKAGSAKTMDKNHPAKQAWDKLADKGGEEEPSGKLGGGDFERDFDDSEPDPEKTKPKDEVGGIKYGKGFSQDTNHMFHFVAKSAPDASDNYSGMVDAVKSNNWKKFKAAIHDIEDDDAREHLSNLLNHVESGTYGEEFPRGKKGLKNARKEVMDLFRQAAEYEDYDAGEDDWDGDESIKVINGKKYKPVKEEKKATEKHLLRETYERIGGK